MGCYGQSFIVPIESLIVPIESLIVLWFVYLFSMCYFLSFFASSWCPLVIFPSVFFFLHLVSWTGYGISLYQYPHCLFICFESWHMALKWSYFVVAWCSGSLVRCRTGWPSVRILWLDGAFSETEKKSSLLTAWHHSDVENDVNPDCCCHMHTVVSLSYDSSSMI